MAVHFESMKITVEGTEKSKSIYMFICRLDDNARNAADINHCKAILVNVDTYDAASILSSSSNRSNIKAPTNANNIKPPPGCPLCRTTSENLKSTPARGEERVGRLAEDCGAPPEPVLDQR